MAGDPFQYRLLPGERILWAGAPPSGLLLTGRDGYQIPFSLVWCGFIVFWMWGATAPVRLHPSNNPMWFFPLFGLPFVLVGLYMIAGRFVIDAWIRGRTSYAVTNQRVLVLRTAPTFKFTTYAIDRLPEL